MQNDLFLPAVADYRTGFEREPLQLSTAGFQPTVTMPEGEVDDLPWDDEGNSLPVDPDQIALPWLEQEQCERCGAVAVLTEVAELSVCFSCEREFYEDDSCR